MKSLVLPHISQANEYEYTWEWDYGKDGRFSFSTGQELLGFSSNVGVGSIVATQCTIVEGDGYSPLPFQQLSKFAARVA